MGLKWPVSDLKWPGMALKWSVSALGQPGKGRKWPVSDLKWSVVGGLSGPGLEHQRRPFSDLELLDAERASEQPAGGHHRRRRIHPSPQPIRCPPTIPKSIL